MPTLLLKLNVTKSVWTPVGVFTHEALCVAQLFQPPEFVKFRVQKMGPVALPVLNWTAVAFGVVARRRTVVMPLPRLTLLN